MYLSWELSLCHLETAIFQFIYSKTPSLWLELCEWVRLGNDDRQLRQARSIISSGRGYVVTRRRKLEGKPLGANLPVGKVLGVDLFGKAIQMVSLNSGCLLTIPELLALQR